MIHASLQDALESLLHRPFQLPRKDSCHPMLWEPTSDDEKGERIRLSFMWRGKPKQCDFHFTPGTKQVLFRDIMVFGAAVDWIVVVNHDCSLSLSCLDENGNVPGTGSASSVGWRTKPRRRQSSLGLRTCWCAHHPSIPIPLSQLAEPSRPTSRACKRPTLGLGC